MLGSTVQYRRLHLLVAGVPNDPQNIVILTTNKAAIHELQKGLEQAGYRTLVAKNLDEAAAKLGDASPALVLVDRPHFSIDTLRPHHTQFQALFVSVWPKNGGCTEEQFVQDFEAGLDDVVSEQTPRQIVAKVRALLRRRQVQHLQQQVLIAGALRMDLDRHEVTVRGNVVPLTPKEFAILQCFLRAPGRVFSREEMLNRVWGEGYALEEHALDVHVHALRHKIERNPTHPDLIVTVRGLGYKLKTN